MVFTVEITRLIESFRLQNDGSWRKLENNSLLESDFRTSDPAEVIRRTPYDREIEIENVSYKVNPPIARMGEALSGVSTVYRREFPEVIPDKGQLRAVIAGGDDNQFNSLILNVNGLFELRQRPEYDIFKNDPTVVVRHETFAPGNSHVGAEAARDDVQIDEWFYSSLKAWLYHVETGVTHEYCGDDELSSGDDEQLLREIALLKSRWVPAY
jgi:hypothetical protein